LREEQVAFPCPTSSKIPLYNQTAERNEESLVGVEDKRRLFELTVR